jgi:hypothetical protein
LLAPVLLLLLLLLLQVYSDFESFFADKRNAQAVCRPSDSASCVCYHSITLVGTTEQTRSMQLGSHMYAASAD